MAKKQTSAPSHAITDHLETLLHTVRAIAQHEDELCTLLHEVQSRGKLSRRTAADLRRLMDLLPAEEYVWQSRAVTTELDATLKPAA